MPFTLHPEFAPAMAKLFGPTPPPKALVGDVASRRAGEQGLLAASKALSPITDVSTQDFHTVTKDGHPLLLRWFRKNTLTSPSDSASSAILYLHGGGMICLSVDLYDEIIKRYVSASGVPVLAPEYRLAPEVQAPVPVRDAYVGLQYLHEHAAELGVNPARIAVMGDSAGGGIAASLAHLAKLQAGPRIAKQILVYPMLDDRNTIEDPNLTPYLVWSADDNKTGWGALLGDRLGSVNVRPIEAAGRMTVQDADGLPPAYIDVGELDFFRDECLEYARKLGKAGVSTELHLIPTVPHAFENFIPTSEVAKSTMRLRVDAMKSF